MFLSCPAKKGTKECGIGEALRVALPRAKDALSYVPLLSRIATSADDRIYKPFQKKCSDFFWKTTAQ